MKPLGFVGIGTMGRPIAGRLMDAGYQLIVHDVVPGSGAALEEQGAIRADTLEDVGTKADIVFLSLPGPQQIANVVTGDKGLLDSLRSGSIIVDLSTNSLQLARELAASCAEAGITYLDAPVSGGVMGARAGTLSIMVGIDDEDAWPVVEPLLGCVGKKIVRVGPVGAGSLVKLVNNQIFLCASVLIQEAFVLGARAGIASEALLDILNESSASVYVRKSAFVLGRDFDAELFRLSIASKDIDLALESAHALGVSMPMTSAAQGVYHEALKLGHGNQVFHATIQVLERRANTQVQEPENGRS